MKSLVDQPLILLVGDLADTGLLEIVTGEKPATPVEGSSLLVENSERLAFYLSVVGAISKETELPSGKPGCRVAPGVNVSPDRAIRQEAAREIMWHFGKGAAADIASHAGQFNNRARARLVARDHAPQDLRKGRGQPRIKELRRPYLGFFSVEERDFTHPTFAGGESAVITRAGLMVPDAVTVLPYDPKSDKVLLIEQLRYGPMMRGDPCPWQLEAIAGHVDPGESCEETARREAREEAGITLDQLERIGSYYASPGAFSEYLTGFVGLADLGGFGESLHGLASESEDIRAFTVPFATLMEALQSGEIDNGPLLISTLWLAAQRPRLRGLSGGP